MFQTNNRSGEADPASRGLAQVAVLAIAVICTMGGQSRGAEPDAMAFQRAMANKAAELGALTGFKGHGDYWFLTSDIRHYGRAIFWGEPAARNTAARQNPDPLPAILDFHAQLKAAGIQLILIPVPGKAAIYADRIDPKLPGNQRLDVIDEAFFKILRNAGIDVIDLAPLLLRRRYGAAGIDSHCMQDSHWSPDGMKLAAMQTAAVIKKHPWYADVAKREAKPALKEIEIEGDIVATMRATGELKQSPPPEKLTIELVSFGGNPVESDRESPVLLIGDSHVIVYHEPIEGGINASHAGFPDHLAAQLGFAPELIANMGSGANAPRMTLARPPRWDNLKGKKCLVWCFSVREFTENTAGWMKIPVIRNRPNN